MLETRFYFAYGANMNMNSMSYRCPNARPIGAFELKDWTLEFFGHANIRPEPGGSVPGVLWAITQECEDYLDAFEGYPDYYIKQSWMQDDRHIMFYEMASFKRGEPTLGYISDIRSSYHYWHLPVEYLDQAINATVKKTTTEYI